MAQLDNPPFPKEKEYNKYDFDSLETRPEAFEMELPEVKEDELVIPEEEEV